MRVTLTITDGPHLSKEFVFDGRDSFLVGRSKEAHFQLSYDDPYFSRRHFVVELNPPRCRLLDLQSRNGVLVNGSKVAVAELSNGDEIKAGHTAFRVAISPSDPDELRTLDLPSKTHLVPLECTSDFQPADRLAEKYELQSEIGRGGMGVVYRARRRSDGQRVAIKIITPAPGADQRQISRFLREAEILGSLSHRNVVGFLDTGECSEGLYIVMEYVDGTDANQLIRDRGPQPIHVSIRMILNVLAGLAHAHEAGFVHRDVKPSNLLIGTIQGKKCVKVADFGLARAFQASQLSGLTLHGDVGGTPAYMPPEQITHYRQVGPPADQYSAAASLYYLLTGQYAYHFVKETAGRLVQILTDDPIPIQKRRPGIPNPLAQVIHRAMSREPTDRYSSLTAFSAALKPFSQAT